MNSDNSLRYSVSCITEEQRISTLALLQSMKKQGDMLEPVDQLLIGHMGASNQLPKGERQVIPQQTSAAPVPIESVASTDLWATFEVDESEPANSGKAKTSSAQLVLPEDIKNKINKIITQLDSYLTLCKVPRQKSRQQDEIPARDILPPGFDLFGLNKRLFNPVTTRSKVNLANAAIHLLDGKYQRLVEEFRKVEPGQSDVSQIYGGIRRSVRILPIDHTKLLCKFAEAYLALDAEIEEQKREETKEKSAIWQSASRNSQPKSEATSTEEYENKLLNIMANEDAEYCPCYPLKFSENAKRIYEALQKLNPFADLAFEIVHTLCQQAGYKDGKASKWYKGESLVDSWLNNYFVTAISLLRQTRYHKPTTFEDILSNLLLINRWLTEPISRRPKVAQFPEIPCPDATTVKNNNDGLTDPSKRQEFLLRNINTEDEKYGKNAPLNTYPSKQRGFFGHIPTQQVVIKEMLEKVKHYENCRMHSILTVKSH